MKKYVKFKGKFADLIPDGWRFWKAFARNYRVYDKTCDGDKWGQRLSIWQHRGGYMEIEDFFSNSHIIVEQVASGKIEDWISEVTSLDFVTKERVCWTLFDMDEKRFLPYHSDEYKAIKISHYEKYSELESGTITEEEYKAAVKAYFKRYREKNFDLKLFDMIKDLLDRGWIEVIEDKRK